MTQPTQLQETIERLQNELAHARRAEAILRAIAEGTAPTTAEDFFYALTYHLAQTLHVDYAFITECIDVSVGRVRTLAYWRKNTFTPNVEYLVEQTPCERVIQDTETVHTPIVYIPDGVQLRYPDEKGVESYLGIALKDSANQVIGHIAVMHHAPLPDEPLAHPTLRIFAVRAAAELQRKNAEMALRDSQERYKMLFESTPLAVFVYDTETLAFLAVNQAAVRHYGYSMERFLSLKLTDIIVREELAVAMAMLAETTSQQSVPLVTRHLRQDSTVIDVETTQRIVMFNGRHACLTLVHDVTERKRIEDERLAAYQTMERHVESRTREIQRRREAAESLREILALLNTDQPLDFVIAYIVRQSQYLLKSDAVAIYLQRNSRFVVQAAENLDSEVLCFDLMTEAIETGLPRTAVLSNSPFRAVLVVPVLIQREPYGCLVLYSQTEREFSIEEKELGVMFADQAALAVENARLRKKAEEMAAMEERNRIARELHDAVSQTLWSAKLIADVLPDIWEQNIEKGRDKFRQFQQLTQAALVEMRSLLLELRPNALLETELGVLLQRLAQSTTARTGIPVSLFINGSHKLPKDVHIAFYRITQEALNNVSRHSLATRVEVSLIYTAQDVTLIIQDNGRGFILEQVAAGHHGITIMRERGISIGAHFQILSKIDEGTMVKLVWLKVNHDD